jgi:hypothetical protein
VSYVISNHPRVDTFIKFLPLVLDMHSASHLDPSLAYLPGAKAWLMEVQVRVEFRYTRLLPYRTKQKSTIFLLSQVPTQSHIVKTQFHKLRYNFKQLVN